MLNVTVLTVFPELFPGFLGYSLTGKALEEQKWQLQTVISLWTTRRAAAAQE